MLDWIQDQTEKKIHCWDSWNDVNGVGELGGE